MMLGIDGDLHVVADDTGSAAAHRAIDGDARRRENSLSHPQASCANEQGVEPKSG
jgi:hypothetical protein